MIPMKTISDENFTIKVQVEDVDNDISELVFSSSTLYGDLNTSLTLLIILLVLIL